MAVGGSIRDVSIGSRTFAVAVDADSTRKLGGAEGEIEMNGDDSARSILKRVPWSISGLTLSIDDNLADQEYLQDCADGIDADNDGFFAITITYASGLTYMARGKPVGEISHASMNTTAPITLSGPGKLTKQ